MSDDILASAFRKIAEGYYNAADVLFESTDAVHVEPTVLGRPVASEPEFPPFEPVEYEALPLAADTPGLGRCPAHDRPWSVKAAGVSKNGKPYSAFWKCDGKEPDGTFCNRKPVKAWADAHPAAAA